MIIERRVLMSGICIGKKFYDALRVPLDYLTGRTNVELDNSIIEKVVEIQSHLKKIKTTSSILWMVYYKILEPNIRTKQAFAR